MKTSERGSWGSNIGFLLAAIGSAVGLGNIWGFPYKMGKCGGFLFLLVYLALAVFVGFSIMCSELALGRKTGSGPILAYKNFTKRFAGVGWLALIAPFLIMTFYSVLGGYCIYYIIINCIGIFGGMPDSSSFGTMLTSPWISIGVLLLFMVICYLINRGGIAAIQIMPPSAPDNIKTYTLTLDGTATTWSGGVWTLNGEPATAQTSGYVEVVATASTTLTVISAVLFVIGITQFSKIRVRWSATQAVPPEKGARSWIRAVSPGT